MGKGKIHQQFFTEHILPWFYVNKRDLPFRKTRSPYHIWISEIMAQQTQIDTLIPYYNRFTDRFPSVRELALADEGEVLKMWEGLGYYSRAKNLHKTAKIIHETCHDVFPEDYREGLKLPGIGPYTGGAIYSIAFNQPVPAIDGNVLRVICRYNHWTDDISTSPAKAKVETWVSNAQPKDVPGDFNESLMELGALICTPKNPQCEICPLQDTCLTFRHGDTQQIPVKSKKAKQKRQQLGVALICFQSSVLLVKRPEKGLLGGLWGLPAVILDPDRSPEETLIKTLFTSEPDTLQIKAVGKDKHVFTHIIWEMSIFRIDLPDTFDPASLKMTQEHIFEPLDRIRTEYALPVAFSKCLKFIE